MINFLQILSLIPMMFLMELLLNDQKTIEPSNEPNLDTSHTENQLMSWKDYLITLEFLYSGQMNNQFFLKIRDFLQMEFCFSSTMSLPLTLSHYHYGNSSHNHYYRNIYIISLTLGVIFRQNIQQLFQFSFVECLSASRRS